jgi:hypothetical protein
VAVILLLALVARALVRKSWGCWARRLRGTRGVAVAAALMARKRRREIGDCDLIMRIVPCNVEDTGAGRSGESVEVDLALSFCCLCR